MHKLGSGVPEQLYKFLSEHEMSVRVAHLRYFMCFPVNNNINTTYDDIYGGVTMAQLRAIARVHPIHRTNADSATDGCQPSDQARQLGM